MVQELMKPDQIVRKYDGDKSALIQILLEIQRQNNWLPKDNLATVSRETGVPLSQIYHVATFYKAFSLVPRGRHMIRVCMGTACHTRGANSIVDNIIKMLNIKPGGVSPDMQFSLSTINCLGCCALGPVMEVDGVYHSKPTREQMEQIFTACE